MELLLIFTVLIAREPKILVNLGQDEKETPEKHKAWLRSRGVLVINDA